MDKSSHKVISIKNTVCLFIVAHGKGLSNKPGSDRHKDCSHHYQSRRIRYDVMTLGFLSPTIFQATWNQLGKWYYSYIIKPYKSFKKTQGLLSVRSLSNGLISCRFPLVWPDFVLLSRNRKGIRQTVACSQACQIGIINGACAWPHAPSHQIILPISKCTKPDVWPCHEGNQLR